MKSEVICGVFVSLNFHLNELATLISLHFQGTKGNNKPLISFAYLEYMTI